MSMNLNHKTAQRIGGVCVFMPFCGAGLTDFDAIPGLKSGIRDGS